MLGEACADGVRTAGKENLKEKGEGEVASREKTSSVRPDPMPEKGTCRKSRGVAGGEREIL